MKQESVGLQIFGNHCRCRYKLLSIKFPCAPPLFFTSVCFYWRGLRFGQLLNIRYTNLYIYIYISIYMPQEKQEASFKFTKLCTYVLGCGSVSEQTHIFTRLDSTFPWRPTPTIFFLFVLLHIVLSDSIFFFYTEKILVMYFKHGKKYNDLTTFFPYIIKEKWTWNEFKSIRTKDMWVYVDFIWLS